MFCVENRERLDTTYRNHRIIRRNIESVKPAQLQLDSPKHLRLRDEIRKKKEKKQNQRKDKKITELNGLHGTGKKTQVNFRENCTEISSKFLKIFQQNFCITWSLISCKWFGLKNKKWKRNHKFLDNFSSDIMTQKELIEKHLSLMLGSPVGYVADQHWIRHDRGKHRRRDRKRKQEPYLLQIDPGFKPITKAKNRAIRKARFKVTYTYSGKTHLLSLSFPNAKNDRSLADLREEVWGTHAPPPPPLGHPNSFNFMQFWENLAKSRPLEGSRPHLGEILDPSLQIFIGPSTVSESEFFLFVCHQQILTL